MPDKCDPCVCPDLHYRDSMSWRKAVLRLLCASLTGNEDVLTDLATIIADLVTINTSINNPTPATNAIFETMVRKGPADIGVAYASATDLPDGTRWVSLDNQTDGDVVVSMNGGTNDHFYLRSYQAITLDLVSMGRVTTAAIHLKDGTVACASGEFFIYAAR